MGCEKCFYTGYRGRKAIYEIIPVDDDIRSCIRDENADIDRIISNKGISTLSSSGYRLLYSGDTSLEEILPFAGGEYQVSQEEVPDRKQMDI